jgi:hypothetical protein
MSAIEVEHNGYKIRLDERDDTWRCHDLRLSNKSLKRVRADINKISPEARRLSSVPLIAIGRYSATAYVTGTLLADDNSGVWCMVPSSRGSNAPPAREKHKFDELALDTAAARAILAEMAKLGAEASKLRDEIERLRASIPRVTAEQLSAIKPDATEEPTP